MLCFCYQAEWGVLCWRPMQALYVQENIGLWSKKTVQCSFGDFAVGNYQSWKAWRANVASADPV